MFGAAGMMAFSSIVGGAMNRKAPEKAAKQAADASLAATALQERQGELFREDVAPYREGGAQAYGRLNDILMGRYDPAQEIRNTPGYQFRLDESDRALERMQSARGQLYSGGAARELSRYTQGLASDAWSQYIDRLLQSSSLGGNITVGQSSNQVPLTQGAANSLMQGGAIQAAGTVGASNAMSRGMTNAMDAIFASQMARQQSGAQGGRGGSSWYPDTSASDASYTDMSGLV